MQRRSASLILIWQTTENGAIVTTTEEIFDLSGNRIALAGKDLKIKNVQIFTIKEDLGLGVLNKP